MPCSWWLKERSLEDVRLGLDKLPERLFEHPATVFVVTNLPYGDAPRLMSRDLKSAASLNWQEVPLKGNSSYKYAEQIGDPHGWQTQPTAKTGKPTYVRPSILVIYREDHRLFLDAVIPKPGRIFDNYDLILPSQPWRAVTSAKFKAEKVLAPLTRSWPPGGRLLAIHSCGADPGFDIVQKPCPGENPFQVDRHQLIAAGLSVRGSS